MPLYLYEMRITLNQKYCSNAELREFIDNIDSRFPQGALVQQGHRNTLRRFTLGGENMVVKHFGKPNIINRIVYTFLRKPKGVRAYEYAFRVISAGFNTPTPVAYIERRIGGLVADSYFISTECPYTRRFYEFGDASISDCEDIVRAFVRATAAFHQAGMLHRDYSPGNILFDNVEGKWQFAFVDINRMSFSPVSIKKGCRNFARLWGQLDFFRVIAEEYAQARGSDAAECFETIRKARRKFWTRFAKKHRVKYRLEL